LPAYESVTRLTEKRREGRYLRPRWRSFNACNGLCHV